MIETVIALLMIVNNEIQEHRIQESMSMCLKGKRIAIGPAGGGTIPFTKQVLGLHGLTIKDIKPVFLSYADGFSQLADGNVDAAFALSGYPAGAVVQAQVNKKLKFIKLASGKMEKGLNKYKNYNK